MVGIGPSTAVIESRFVVVVALLWTKYGVTLNNEKIEIFHMQHDTYPGRQGPLQPVLLFEKEEGGRPSSACVECEVEPKYARSLEGC